MKYTFPNKLLAGAFLGALCAGDESNLGNDIAIPDDDLTQATGPVTIDCDTDGCLSATLTSIPAGATKVHTLAQLEAALAKVLSGDFKMKSGETGNQIDHDISIYRDGSIGVGCKTFTKAEADGIAALTKGRARRKLRQKVGKHYLTTDPAEVDEGYVGIGGEEISWDDLRWIVARREKFLASAAKPLRLFARA